MAAQPGQVLAAGGNLDHFDVSVSGTSTAGAALSLTLTAKDAFNRTVRNYTGTKCLTFGGLATSPNATAPSYPAAVTCLSGTRDVSFANGAASPSVTAYSAGSNTLNVSDPSIPFSGSSGAFTVRPGPVASLTFSAQPIDTKTGTPIYHTCVPDPNGTNPCATPTQSPASSPVTVNALDAYGNIPTGTVAINLTGTNTQLGSASLDPNGVASFGDTLVLTTLGPAGLTASVGTATADSTGFQIVYDLKACDAQSCKNSASNGLKNLQRAVNTITTSPSGDFFNGSNNVLLTTQFLASSTFDGKCSSTPIIGQGTEAKVEGAGITTTQPTTTMLLILPKRTLQALGVSSRSAASFNVCLGATRLDGVASSPWTAEDATGAFAPATQDVADPNLYWGLAADCTRFTAGSTDPCAAVKTKNVSEVQAYFTSIGDTATAASIPLIMANSDLAIVVRTVYPWDGKTGLY